MRFFSRLVHFALCFARGGPIGRRLIRVLVELSRFREVVSRLMQREYGISWSDACGDDKPLLGAIDSGETPEDFVDRFAVKYDLTSLNEIFWMIGSRNGERRW